MTLVQAGQAKKIIVPALAVLALAGCGKAAASTTTNRAKPVRSRPPTLRRGFRDGRSERIQLTGTGGVFAYE